MTVLITLTLAGSDTGPFNLYSNADGYTTAFETGISRAALIAGYTSTLAPEGTTEVLVRSTGVCQRDLYLVVSGAPIPTTTTTSSTSTTSTSTTQAPNPCPAPRAYTITNAGTFYWVDCYGNDRRDYFNQYDEICICDNVNLPVSFDGGTGTLAGGGCTCD
jgi:hypothetical protein